VPSRHTTRRARAYLAREGEAATLIQYVHDGTHDEQGDPAYTETRTAVNARFSPQSEPSTAGPDAGAAGDSADLDAEAHIDSDLVVSATADDAGDGPERADRLVRDNTGATYELRSAWDENNGLRRLELSEVS
jgi:hypothetical protein